MNLERLTFFSKTWKHIKVSLTSHSWLTMSGSIVRLNEMVIAHPLHLTRMLLLLLRNEKLKIAPFVCHSIPKKILRVHKWFMRHYDDMSTSVTRELLTNIWLLKLYCSAQCDGKEQESNSIFPKSCITASVALNK